MQVSLEEVRQIFNSLINGEIDREHASEWALTRLFANDENDLEYEPKCEKERIWKGIVYLTGVDLLNGKEGDYFHCLEDFINYKNELGI